MDSKQILKVSLKAIGSFKGYQSFYTQMRKDGKITIPTIQQELLKNEKEQTLEHYLMEVTLEPT